MDPFLPFACPQCGLPSVAVGVCPDCRMALVARAVAPAAKPAPTPVAEGIPAVPVHSGSPADCKDVLKQLSQAGIPAAISPGPDRTFLVLVPENQAEQAQEVLQSVWTEDAERQGLAPVGPGEALALALEAESRCPACGDPCLPESPACSSCGIALA